MEGSAGSFLDLLDKPFDPSDKELAKAVELKEQLKDMLSKERSLHKRVREALTEYVENEEFLLIFVRGRKLDVLKAATSIKHYADLKHVRNPELFPDEVPDFVQYVYHNRILEVLRNRDHLGRTIVIFALDKWDPTITSLDQIVAAGRYLVEFAVMKVPEALKLGFVLVHNMHGASFSHARHYTIPIALKTGNIFWRSYPVPLKGFYFVNVPVFLRAILAIGRPFLPKKLNERFLVASGVEELHERISPTLLPQSLGGELADDDLMPEEISRRVHMMYAK